MKPVRIGCSGWNYRHWRDGVFYPPRLPPRRWLEHYARHFDTVEVNSTFYRLPIRSAVAGWAEGSPAGFVFAVEASRSSRTSSVSRISALDSSASTSGSAAARVALT